MQQDRAAAITWDLVKAIYAKGNVKMDLREEQDFNRGTNVHCQFLQKLSRISSAR